MDLQKRARGIFLILLAAMLWGVSGTVAQYLFQQKGFSPEWLVDIRLLVAGLILVVYGLIKDREKMCKVWKTPYDIFNILLFGIVGMLGVQYTYFITIKFGNAATATILQYLSPVIITCYLCFKAKKSPSFKEFIGVALAMLGTFLIISKGNIHSISISNLTVFWGILSAFAAAFYTVQPKYLLKNFGSTSTVGWGMIIGGMAFSFICAPWEFSGEWSMESLLAVIFVVIFGTLIAFYCYLESLKYIQPTEASVLSSAEPLSAAFLSILWLNVSLGVAQWIGTICVISTIIILSIGRKGE